MVSSSPTYNGPETHSSRPQKWLHQRIKHHRKRKKKKEEEEEEKKWNKEEEEEEEEEEERKVGKKKNPIGFPVSRHPPDSILRMTGLIRSDTVLYQRPIEQTDSIILAYT